LLPSRPDANQRLANRTRRKVLLVEFDQWNNYPLSTAKWDRMAAEQALRVMKSKKIFDSETSAEHRLPGECGKV
jgi:hypothetical protein